MLTMGMRWRCPFCGTHAFITAGQQVEVAELSSLSRHGDAAMLVESVSCPNADCQELTISVAWGTAKRDKHDNLVGLNRVFAAKTRRLTPEVALKTLSSSVPEEVATTYREAALIAPISGRASAAMARRCLQGMVRDFFNIPHNKRGNLGAELSYAKEQIDPQLWADIQAIRELGDIGAHMDKNVNQIIDVTPEEAQLLIELLETLFGDWYEARARRDANRSALRSTIEQKRAAQKAAKAASPANDQSNLEAAAADAE